MGKEYKLTEQERDSIERAMFQAAAEMLRPSASSLLEHYAASDFRECVIAVLQATDVVMKQSRHECRRIAKQRGADYADLDVDANHIVASALLASTERAANILHWSPYSAGAVPVLVFARAFALGHIANQFDNLAMDYESFEEPGVALRALGKRARTRLKVAGEQGDGARDPKEST